MRKEFLVLVFFASMLIIPGVLAEHRLLCLSDGQRVQFSQCNPAMHDETCTTTLCQFCVTVAAPGVYCPAHPGHCNAEGLHCTFVNTNGTIDSEPPVLTVSAPTEGGVYRGRSTNLVISASEESDISVLDNINSRSGWRSVCTGCTNYANQRTFSEGLNNITVRARDRAGNSAFSTITFRIDSQAPRVKKVLPADGFSSGAFQVTFTEANPADVVLHYGNAATGMRTQSANLGSDCVFDRDSTCNVTVDVADYDGAQIEYWFTVQDIAGSSAESRHTTLGVKTSDPVLSDVEYTVNGKAVTFTIHAEEPFLDAVTYEDTADAHPQEKTLCTSLQNNMCIKKISFSHDGTHDVVIRVKDEAGNMASETVHFFTDSKKPKIMSVDPSKGFASGVFDVQFDEQNPVALTFYYGAPNGAMQSRAVDLVNECVAQGNGKYNCNIVLDVSPFNNGQLRFGFDLADRAGAHGASKNFTLGVDTIAPIITSIDQVVSRGQASVNVHLDEANFASATYVNSQDTHPTEKRLCTSLRAGVCSGRIAVRSGDNVIQLTATDKAGNSVAQSFTISVP